MGNKTIKTTKIARLTKMGTTLAKATGKFFVKKTFDRTVKEARDLKVKIDVAKDIVQSMGELKGAFMKMGQMLSISDDLILPPEISELFKELQKDAPPMPRSDLDKVFLNSFGKIPEGLFKSFDRTPLAAASIGQVHKAVLPSGEKVAVKVQYPNILKATQNDFKNIDQIKKFFSLIFPGVVDVTNLVTEMKRSLLQECDYVKERSEMASFKSSFAKDFPNIHVPETFEAFCSESILTMEFLEGDDFEESLKYSQEERDFLGQLLFDSYIYSLFKKRRIHSDPQNGNYFFSKNNIKLLDYGSTREFPADFVKRYAAILLAMEEDDFALYKKVIIDLGVFIKTDSEELFQRHFELIKETYNPYTLEGSYPLLEVNPFLKVKDFIKTVDLKKRKFPREEFFLLDRSTLGLFLKLRRWGSRVNWVRAMKKYRGPLDEEIRRNGID